MCPGNSDILKYPEPYGAYVQVVSQSLSVGETVVVVAIVVVAVDVVVVVLVDELAVTRKETNHIEWNGMEHTPHTQSNTLLRHSDTAHSQQIT